MNKEKKIESLFDDNKDVKFGCVCFDMHEGSDGKMSPLPGNGWASIEGKSAFRIRSVADLSPDVKWWSNLNKNTLWNSGKQNLLKLKRSDYLKTDLGDIMKELQMSPPNIPIANICEYLSDIFNRVMRMAIEFYGLNDFQKEDLIEELNNHLLAKDENIDISIDQAFMRSYQDRVFCETNNLNLEGHKKIYLRRPRVQHAKLILDTRIPVKNSKWEVIFPEDLPETKEERLEFLLNNERPFICKVKILSFHEMDNAFINVTKLLNMGESIAPKNVRKKRDWMCQTELLYYSKFANLDIEAVIIGDRYDEECYDNLLPDMGPLGNMSYSYGLLSECVWHAITDRSYDKLNKSKTLVSPRACWLKATDRFLTLTSAMMLSSQGHNVLSYGSGSVVVSIADNDIAKLIEQAPAAGLTVPRWLVEKYQLSKQLLD